MDLPLIAILLFYKAIRNRELRPSLSLMAGFFIKFARKTSPNAGGI
ncbi:MAG: hypothetical protein LBI71_00650 [Enterobacteriaceae bacterium]|jgi:hypothetical protein|nr:hypothetical protein [Enterobacteriaceae bacterium]